MKDSENDLKLFNKYLNLQCNAAEIEELLSRFSIISETDLRKLIYEALAEEEQGKADLNLEDHLNSLYQTILPQLQARATPVVTKRSSKIFFYRMRVAACIVLLLLSFLLWFFIPKFSDYPEDIAPASARASLTLSDGQVVTLEDKLPGTSWKTGGFSVKKIEEGLIVFNPEGEKAATGQLNSISTPQGGTYRVALPDGTHVWLNAASELSFPTSLTVSKQRKVFLKGEGYFEVHKDASRPFIVKTKQTQIEVLGTHFNVNAYPDEIRSSVTLLEGSVKIHSGQASVVLKPNEEATFAGNNFMVKQANIDQVMGWKDGFFIFDDETLENIMIKISRWYNVEVIYEGVDIHKRFGGSISRALPISKVLRQMELTQGIHFKIDGRRVFLME